MIPKIIHYCWFGGKPLPDLAKKCIESWKKYLPDYEIKEWNESNFDVNSILYTRQAYNRKKYAFVSDYARFWILYNYGGIYFDVDVELIKSLRPILDKGAYMGLEGDNSLQKGVFTGNDLGVECNPGLGMAAYPKMPFIGNMLAKYKQLDFIFASGAINTKTIVSYTSEELIAWGYDINKKGIQSCYGFQIYPKIYFCPVIEKESGKILVDKNLTYSIHHYAATWVDSGMILKGKISSLMMKILPIPMVREFRKLWRFILRKH